MRGQVSELNLYDVKTKYGLISGFDGKTYYFNEKSLLTWQQNIRKQLCTFEQICILLSKLTTEKLPLKPFMKRGKSLYACGNPKKR